MSRLTRDGMAKPVSRDQILTVQREKFIFPVHRTTSRIGNHTRLFHTLLKVLTIHTYLDLSVEGLENILLRETSRRGSHRIHRRGRLNRRSCLGLLICLRSVRLGVCPLVAIEKGRKAGCVGRGRSTARELRG